MGSARILPCRLAEPLPHHTGFCSRSSVSGVCLLELPDARALTSEQQHSHGPQVYVRGHIDGQEPVSTTFIRTTQLLQALPMPAEDGGVQVPRLQDSIRGVTAAQ